MLTINRDDLDQMDKRYRTNLVNSLSGYKSANLLGTIDQDGLTNVAIVSSVFHVGANPPLIGMLMRPHTVPRHSLENIIHTESYTLNHVHSGMIEQAHQTAARYPKEESEFTATGLTPIYRGECPAPFVGECKLGIALKLSEKVTLANETELIIGEVVSIYIESDCIEKDGYVDIACLDTVCVSGLDSYHRSERIKRMPYPKPS